MSIAQRAQELIRAAEKLLAVVDDTAGSEQQDDDVAGARIRVLLLEVLRRAAYDWVLYRGSRRAEHKEIAHDAYVWLFEEDAHHPWARVRKEEHTELMSFLSICEVMGFDPDGVRASVRRLTPEKIKTAGRPPERRKKQTEDASYYSEYGVLATYSTPDD